MRPKGTPNPVEVVREAIIESKKINKAMVESPQQPTKITPRVRSIPAGHISAISDRMPGISDVQSVREEIPVTGQTLLGTGNAISDKTCPHRHVRLKMTMKERLKYVPPKGINVLFYAPNKTDLQLPASEVNATFYCPILNPNRDEQRYIDDIDEELANLRVIQDNIHEWHEPNLVKQPKVLIHVLIEKMHNDPDLDKHIKNMRDITKTDVTESAIKEINSKENLSRYQKLKKSLLKQTERKTIDGDKINEGSIGVL